MPPPRNDQPWPVEFRQVWEKSVTVRVDPIAERRCPTAARAAVLPTSRRGDPMKRRTFAILLMGTLAGPHFAAAQVAGKARIGWISIANHPLIDAFREGMRKRGFVEGENLTIDYRYAEGHAERLPGLVAELVAARVDVIVASGSDTVLAAYR